MRIKVLDFSSSSSKRLKLWILKKLQNRNLNVENGSKDNKILIGCKIEILNEGREMGKVKEKKYQINNTRMEDKEIITIKEKHLGRNKVFKGS